MTRSSYTTGLNPLSIYHFILYFAFFILHGIAYWNMMYYSSSAPNKKCRPRKIQKTPRIAICCSIRPLQHHYCSQMEHKWSTGRERLSASVTMKTLNRFTDKHYRAATNDWWVGINKRCWRKKNCVHSYGITTTGKYMRTHYDRNTPHNMLTKQTSVYLVYSVTPIGFYYHVTDKLMFHQHIDTSYTLCLKTKVISTGLSANCPCWIIGKCEIYESLNKVQKRCELVGLVLKTDFLKLIRVDCDTDRCRMKDRIE